MHVTLAVWALGVGLIQGFLHCSGMCGPFVMAFSLSTRPGESDGVVAVQFWQRQFIYNAGRILTFGVLGALFGEVGSFVNMAARLHGLQAFAGFVGGGLMVGWALNEFLVSRANQLLERWSLLSLPIVQRAFRRLSVQRGNASAFLSGLVMGLHPCGLLFAMLFSAAASGSALAGGLVLLAFGLGTLPSLLSVAAVGWAGRKRVQGAAFTYTAAALVGLSGVLFVLRGMAVNGWIPKVNPWLF